MFQQDGKQEICAGAKFKEHLSSMSVQELQAELGAIFEREESAGVEADPELIAEYLTAIEKMKPSTHSQAQSHDDFEKSWTTFTKNHPELFPPEKEENTVPAKDHHVPAHSLGYRLWRSAVAVASAAILLFALMIGAQAVGLDVFGTLARWTDSTFHHVTTPRDRDETIGLENTAYGTIDVQRILGEYTPTRLPDGATAAASSIREDEFGVASQVSFSLPDNKQFFVRVEQYPEREDIDSITFERDPSLQEEYLSSSRLFYIFSNDGYYKATWSDSTTMITILGDLSVDELKFIIDSIGG